MGQQDCEGGERECGAGHHHPASYVLAAAEGSAEIETATQQLERALFLQAKWLLPED
jgi:hypothetical protein